MMGIHVGLPSRLIWPLFNPTQKKRSQSARAVTELALGREPKQESGRGRGEWATNWTIRVSFAARGQKRTVVTHIPEWIWGTFIYKPAKFTVNFVRAVSCLHGIRPANQPIKADSWSSRGTEKWNFIRAIELCCCKFVCLQSFRS